MSEYLKCPLCGAPMDQEAESDNTVNMFKRKITLIRKNRGKCIYRG